MKDIELKNNKALEIPKVIQQLTISMPEYQGMLEVINSNLPEIRKSTENFNKTQSQFMDNMLTVSHMTPLRNVRQILAQMNQTELALKEAYIKVSRKEVELEMKQRELNAEEDELKQKMIQLDMLELHTHMEATKSAIGGALRKMTNYSIQYNAILDNKDMRNFTEEDFEKEEEKYHIMKAFDQGVTAARSRQGIVDEGNMIYFTQIGINGGTAQKCVFEYLNSEGRMIVEGKEPTSEMYVQFLESMADKFKNASKSLAKYKGLNEDITQVALVNLKKE